MTDRPAPPRLATRILATRLPSDLFEAIAGDLEEEFVEQHGARGSARAALWYWREVLGFVVTRHDFAQRGADGRGAEAAGLASVAQLRFSWLDVKLGLRMLPKHPMLNLAAVFALAVGIPVGLAPSHLARALEAPLPGDADDRVRAIRHWDPRSSGVARAYTADPRDRGE
jgi:hypothetical protein